MKQIAILGSTGSIGCNTLRVIEALNGAFGVAALGAGSNVELLPNAAAKSGAELLPVDSEHNALHQCLRGEKREELKRLILTASGGPFRMASKEEIENATRAQALKHPTWQMGAKITIDSATL